jgi:anti-sigma-K factor RskA/putative zinc finger protein
VVSMSSSSLSRTDCEKIQELIPDYAFGLTGADETRLVESQLTSCPEAALQLADFRRLQDEMRESVDQMEPPPQLGERLMAAAVPAARPRRMQWAWIAAAAVFALIVTNGYWLLRVNTSPSQVQPPDTNAFILTSTSNLRWARLPASQETSQASAFLMWNGESKIGLLYARGFEERAAGETYRLWLTKGDDKVSAGTFSVDDKGIGTLLFNITDPIDKYTWAHITDEVTGEVVANGQLTVN